MYKNDTDEELKAKLNKWEGCNKYITKAIKAEISKRSYAKVIPKKVEKPKPTKFKFKPKESVVKTKTAKEYFKKGD